MVTKTQPIQQLKAKLYYLRLNLLKVPNLMTTLFGEDLVWRSGDSSSANQRIEKKVEFQSTTAWVFHSNIGNTQC